VESSDPIDVAAVRMHKNKISALPVVDWMKKPMGIITSEDISKLMSITEFKT
jgi:CBS domain-containing protein